MKRRAFLTATAAATQIRAAAPAEPRRRSSYWGPAYYDENEKQQVLEVIDTGSPFRWYGPDRDKPPMKVATFEKEFAAWMKRKYALAVSSGTMALEAAMVALGIGPGDEVILPAWTWHSTATAVIRAGALPVFAEIDESLNIDPKDIEARITPQTKVIVAVHLQGGPADMDGVMAIARKHKLRVLEDCAQSVGASYKGRPLGSIGDIGIYSHQLNKTITAGEGGSVVTDDPVLFERAARFHDVGGIRGPHQALLGKTQLGPFVGTNARMNEFSGGVMLAQVRKLQRMVDDVRRNSRRVYDGIRDLKGIRFRRVPDPEGELGSVVFLRFDSKERCQAFMKGMSAERVSVGRPGGSVVLPTQPYIENKVASHPAWPTWTSPRGKAIQYGAASCPRTLDVLSRLAGPGIHPKMTKDDTDRIVAAIRKVYPTV